MEIHKLQEIYGRHPLVRRLAQVLQQKSARHVCLSGLQGSSASLFFASLALRSPQVLGVPFLFVLDDSEEAAYFYQDLTQMLGDTQVLYFPSSYRRAVKYGQRDAANVVLRTEALSRLGSGTLPLFVVTCPQALAELVVDRDTLKGHTLEVGAGQTLDVVQVQKTLLDLGFSRTDYVYEPGQFAVRGSLLDVYSYSSEYPYRIDFFGDEVDSIRTFDVQDQLSL
ncbi:MAG TPA: transcription-repair coupling factor, partial [Prevotellaceae bacterium]|nr:transcription-repair coupling factor [Prevotellaceae bacterium]